MVIGKILAVISIAVSFGPKMVITYPMAKRLRQLCDEDLICPFRLGPSQRIHLHPQLGLEICLTLQIISNQLLDHCT